MTLLPVLSKAKKVNWLELTFCISFYIISYGDIGYFESLVGISKAETSFLIPINYKLSSAIANTGQ